MGNFTIGMMYVSVEKAAGLIHGRNMVVTIQDCMVSQLLISSMFSRAKDPIPKIPVSHNVIGAFLCVSYHAIFGKGSLTNT